MRRMIGLVGLALALLWADLASAQQKYDLNLKSLAVTGDQLVVTGRGMLHTLVCSSDTAATAGTIIVYNNTAESGTIIWSWTVSAVEYQPFSLLFDVAFDVGLYIGYTTTNDVKCTVTYR